MTGKHRGKAALNARLIRAVLAAGLGRGYLGEHRLARTPLGLPVADQPVLAVQPSELDLRSFDQRLLDLRPLEPAPSVVRVTAAGATLTLVPVVKSSDPLVDTAPHPIVKLFPLPAVPDPHVDLEVKQVETA